MATERGTTKTKDTKASKTASEGVRTAAGNHRGAEGQGNQITHLNRGIVEAWLDTISKDEAQKVADYANKVADGERVGSELT